VTLLLALSMGVAQKFQRQTFNMIKQKNHLLTKLANNTYICCTVKKVTTLLQDLVISKSEIKTMASTLHMQNS
jgi:hypothetical protein